MQFSTIPLNLADPETPFGIEISELFRNVSYGNRVIQRSETVSVVFGESGSPLLSLIQPPTNLVQKTNDHRYVFVPEENLSVYGVTSQNCEVLWPSGLKSFTPRLHDEASLTS